MTVPEGSPPQARDLLRKYDLHPKRSFSQNFLIQPGAIQQIVDATTKMGNRVIEIGPGLGALTHALLASGCAVTAVELDRDMVRVLEQEYGHCEGLAIVEADAAKFDFRAEADSNGSALVVVGNLPYQSTGAIVRRLVEHREALRGAVLMVQREVRDRLVAAPGGKDYGALTVFTQAVFEIDTLFRLRPGSFYPPPKVESAVVSLKPRDASLAQETLRFRAVVRAAFQARRKTLRNALRPLGSPGEADAALSRSRIDPQRRGESLSITEFRALADAWDELAPPLRGE